MQTAESMSSYNALLKKLQDFITKYYAQILLRGLLQLCILFISIYLITTTLEYNLYLSSSIRTVLFWLFLLGAGALTVYWVAIPLYQYLNYRTRMDEKLAASIIGNHFSNVQDKLLNILYLNEMKSSSHSNELIDASIQQKSRNLSLVRFNEAIDWARNQKLLKYLSIPIALLITILVFFPNLIQDSTYRLVNYNQTFMPKAPFDFILKTDHLQVPQFESIEVRAILKGKSLPEELNLLHNGISYPMTIQKGEFTTTLKNIEKATSFRLESISFRSR
jgi:hypothetical protein